MYVPSSELGLSQPISLASECAPTHSHAGEGLGESLFRRREKSLALCLLCGFNYSMHFHLCNQLGGHPCVAGLLAAYSVCHPVHYHSVQHLQLGSTIFFRPGSLLFNQLASSEVILHCLSDLVKLVHNATHNLGPDLAVGVVISARDKDVLLAEYLFVQLCTEDQIALGGHRQKARVNQTRRTQNGDSCFRQRRRKGLNTKIRSTKGPVLVVLKNKKKFNFLKSRLKSKLNKQ